MNIDKHNPVWKKVEEYLRDQRNDAVNALIADKESDKQRGKIDLIDSLISTVYDDVEPVQQDNY